MSPACHHICENFGADSALPNQNLLRDWKSYTRLRPSRVVIHQMLWLSSILDVRVGFCGHVKGHVQQVLSEGMLRDSAGGERC